MSWVEERVGAGDLRPGDLLPPVRTLASELSVSAGTVAAAYRSLRDRGTVQTDGRRGTRVRARPATVPREQPALVLPPEALDLASGNPSVAVLPPLAGALAAAAGAAGLYDRGDLSTGFASAAAQRLEADGVPATHLAATSGALDAIERVLLAHLRPGDAVAVEDPGWGNLLDLLAALGLRAEPVRVDAEGPHPGAVAAALARGARGLVVTSRGQNPTGAALSRDRSRALAEVLARHPATLLVEDDHAAEVAGVPLASLAGATDTWAYVRSASKAWGPDLRLALLAGDAATVERVRARQRLGPGWVSRVLQEALAGLWADGEAQERVSRARERYAAARAGLVDALAERGVEATGRSGVNVWVPVGDETSVVARLAAAGYGVAAGARFRVASPPGVRVTVADLPAEHVGPLADALAAAVRAPGRRTV